MPFTLTLSRADSQTKTQKNYMPTYHVAHSPDSDDAFMFWALATEKIDTADREYVHELSDIESLNQRAMNAELEVTAVSFHAYAHLTDRYALLPHGASIGDRYGPKIVARDPRPDDVAAALKGLRVAIPGEMTTAYLVAKMVQADFTPVPTPFDEIEEAVAAGNVDAGLLIHEGQLTYGNQGLHLWLDLGEWWYDQTDGLPLPLGCNVVRRDLGEDTIKKVSRDLRSSITYGLANRKEALDYAMKYARGLTVEDADTFVGMYVNDYTVDYGETGRRAVHALLDRAQAEGLVPAGFEVIFIDDE
jgi:1,4-dihydroxy-6-naphthoate synthase